MNIGLMHPTGNPFARQAAIALAEQGQLTSITTSIAHNPQHLWAQKLAKLAPSLARELERRTWLAPEGVSLHQFLWPELLRILLLKARLPQRLGFSPQRLTDWLYHQLDQHFAWYHLAGLTGVYAYEDGAAETFTVAKQWGMRCFYDLPIVYYRQSQQIQQQEAAQFPELAPALLSLQEPAAKLARKDQELVLADRVIVPSTIVKDSLATAPVNRDRVHVVPFGAPIDYCQPQPKQHPHFRVLFVGRVGPRKGVHYLLQAWRLLALSDAQLQLIGVNEFPPGWLNPERDRFTYIPSIPHAQLPAHYAQASVLVLPSLIEGLALVQLEALAAGLPLITTANAGGTDIITDGVEGFVVPIRDPETLAEKIMWCYEHPEELMQMRQAARRRAEVLSWRRYRQQLQGVIQGALG
ncbi:MAG: glycosyltransferase family 4 protein [Spirulina sp. SIO3F2]|nr:glycosyltransferase family 4 protein [Spirulina sp. SIO3F2]